MIISKTPYRIPLAGGGTDIDFYYKKKGGLFITCTFDQGIYVSVSERQIDKKILIQTTDTQFCYSVKRVKHEIIREALKYFGIKNKIQINCFSTLPTQSGLGTSSALIVGLIKALSKLKRKNLSNKQIVQIAYKIERITLGYKGGWQDQIASTFGGVLKVNISKKGGFQVKKLKLQKKTIRKINNHLVLVFTNEIRDSSKIINSQKKEQNINYYDEIKNFVPIINSAILKGDYNLIGKIFHKHWLIKKKLSNKISSNSIDNIYLKLLKEKSIVGGKIIGAGGGGFFLIVTKNLKKTVKFLKKKNFNFSKINIETEGSKVISS